MLTGKGIKTTKPHTVLAKTPSARLEEGKKRLFSPAAETASKHSSRKGLFENDKKSAASACPTPKYESLRNAMAFLKTQ